MLGPTEIENEIKRAEVLCKKCFGRTPDVRFSISGEHIYWAIYGSVVLKAEKPFGVSMEIGIGPEESLIECIIKWNYAVDKLEKTIFFQDLI